METQRVHIKHEGKTKNTDGHLGPICNNCGGFGYTLALGTGGGSSGCHYCGQTGVATMSNTELQKEFIALKEDIKNLRDIIIRGLGKEFSEKGKK